MSNQLQARERATIHPISPQQIAAAGASPVEDEGPRIGILAAASSFLERVGLWISRGLALQVRALWEGEFKRDDFAAAGLSQVQVDMIIGFDGWCTSCKEDFWSRDRGEAIDWAAAHTLCGAADDLVNFTRMECHECTSEIHRDQYAVDYMIELGGTRGGSAICVHCHKAALGGES